MDERHQRIETAWDDFQQAMDGIPDERMTEPGVVESWSVKDLIAHVSFWEEYLIDRIEGRPTASTASSPDVDDLNAEVAAERAGWPLSQARDHATTAHARMLESLAQHPDATEPLVAVNTWDHYAEHAAHIRDWRAQLRI